MPCGSNETSVGPVSPGAARTSGFGNCASAAAAHAPCPGSSARPIAGTPSKPTAHSTRTATATQAAATPLLTCRISRQRRCLGTTRLPPDPHHHPGAPGKNVRSPCAFIQLHTVNEHLGSDGKTSRSASFLRPDSVAVLAIRLYLRSAPDHRGTSFARRASPDQPDEIGFTRQPDEIGFTRSGDAGPAMASPPRSATTARSAWPRPPAARRA